MKSLLNVYREFIGKQRSLLNSACKVYTGFPVNFLDISLIFKKIKVYTQVDFWVVVYMEVNFLFTESLHAALPAFFDLLAWRLP